MKINIVSFVIVALVCFGCKKEQGCTDISADNYVVTAEEDDGSCTYSAEAYFYFSYTAKRNFENNGITDLKIYIDDEFVGFQAVDVSLGNFGCDNSSTISKVFTLTDGNSETHHAEVKNNDTGERLFQKSFDVYPSDCKAVEILY